MLLLMEFRPICGTGIVTQILKRLALSAAAVRVWRRGVVGSGTRALVRLRISADLLICLTSFERPGRG